MKRSEANQIITNTSRFRHNTVSIMYYPTSRITNNGQELMSMRIELTDPHSGDVHWQGSTTSAYAKISQLTFTTLCQNPH